MSSVSEIREKLPVFLNWISKNKENIKIKFLQQIVEVEERKGGQNQEEKVEEQ